MTGPTGAPVPAAPAHWTCDAILRDGGTLHVRPAGLADVPTVLAFYTGLTDKTTYLRFFSPRTMSQEDVRAELDVDHVNTVALLAELGGRVVGLASYVRLDPGGPTAEVAFVVEEDHQQRGLGSLLLEHLAAAARERGISKFVAEVLSENRQMLNVFQDAGYTLQRHRDGSVVEVEFLIEPTDAARAVVEAREHRAEQASVRRLLFPDVVAVIGASRRKQTAGHQVLRNMLSAGFTGTVHPVNPSATEIAGLPAHPSVTAIPGPVDLAVIAVPAGAVMDAVADCVDKGVHGVVILTAGFSELGNDQAEAALRDLALGGGIRIVGPNCIGLLNTAVGLDATFSSFAPLPGRVGMMSQSGAVGIALLERSHRTGVGVSTFVSVGNKADVSGNDMLQYWEDDPATAVILLYLESFGSPQKFARIARRVSRRTPIVAVKGGRTAVGGRAASSHTAAVTSSDTTVDALFRQTGVIRVDTLEELFDMALLLSCQPLPRGGRVAIVGNSGGPGILAADACAAAGLTVQPFTTATHDALQQVVDPNGSIDNPVDLIATADMQTYRATLEIVLADPDIDAVLVVCTPLFAADPDEVAQVIADVAVPDKPVVGAFLAWPKAPRVQHGGDGSGVPLFDSPEPAVRALGRAVDHARWRVRDPGTMTDLGIDAHEVEAVAASILADRPDGGWLSTAEVARLLDAVGVKVLEAEVVADADQAAAAADRISGPVALKALGPELVHKSDVGGVRLGIDTADGARQEYEDMAAALGQQMDGALVQRMATPGVEIIIGVTHDPLFGPVVVFGLGGVATELLGDHAFRILPLTNRDAAEMIRSLRGSPLLFGHRGSELVDADALEVLLQRIARLAGAVPQLAELDLNPVVASGHEIAVVDARIRFDPTLDDHESQLRRRA